MLSKRPNRPIEKYPLRDSLTLSPNTLDTTDLVLAYCENRGLYDNDKLSIEQLINETNELTLVYKDLGKNDAYIKKLANGKYEIAINSKHHRNRQRFSIAHEFAHFQLHRDQIDGMSDGEQILHRSEERNTIETQANSFAAQILMPEDKFKEQLSKLAGSISEMARHFGVSQLALRYRAKTLGIGGHGV